jgi:hypothetical protein
MPKAMFIFDDYTFLTHKESNEEVFNAWKKWVLEQDFEGRCSINDGTQIINLSQVKYIDFL